MKKKIGLLYSKSGTTAFVEKAQLQACLLAIEEVNNRGSISFEPVVGDVKCDPKVAAKEAYRLLTESKVDVLVGPYTSSCRKSVLEILNENYALLLYPTHYEGEERHPNIFYCGALPNQQVEPMLSWIVTNISDKFVLLGSDYIYPRCANRHIREWVVQAGGEILYERYYILGSNQFDSVFRHLHRLAHFTTPIVVYSTLVGTSVISFYKEYRKRQLPFPIVSPVTSELEIHLMGPDAASGHYCAAAYFQDIDTAANSKFVRKYREHFGPGPISHELASCYDTICLLAEAYNMMPSGNSSRANEIEALRTQLKRVSFCGLQGKVIMDPRSQQLWQWSRFGRVKPDGALDLLWVSAGPIPPRQHNEPTVPSIGVQPKPDSMQGFLPLIGQNRRFRECVTMARIAGKTYSSSVLIIGKSGTGKELFARAIHEASARNGYPFIPVNCAAIPRELVASELFGYEEGSFTGAKRGGKPGKFELADKGTLFLDEICGMPMELQGHLLRVLQEKEVFRIGGSKPIRFDVRVIAATSKELLQEIADGSFRSDLFYRLNVFYIYLPLLSERQDDIPLLMNHFIERLNSIHSCNKALTPEALDILVNYSWPGNVRELANEVERSFYVAQDSVIIRPVHLAERIINEQQNPKIHDGVYTTETDLQEEEHVNLSSNFAGIHLDTWHQYLDTNQKTAKNTLSIKENERLLIMHNIVRTGYNISQASRLLGMSRRTIYRKMKEYNIVAIPDWKPHSVE